MKKIAMAISMAFVLVVVNSCSTMNGGSGNTASSLGTSILTSALTNGNGSSSTGGSLASTGVSVLGNLLSSVLGSKTTTTSLYGTWTYTQPSVKFESENVLSKIGGTVMSNKIESALQKQLTNIGFTSGKSTITFKQDGTFTMTLSKKSYSGTYTYNSSTNTMTLKGAFGLASLSCTTTVSMGKLYMLFDADKLFSAIAKVGSLSKTLSGLLGSYNGMKMGWEMTK